MPLALRLLLLALSAASLAAGPAVPPVVETTPLAQLLTPTLDVPRLVTDDAAKDVTAIRPVPGRPLAFTLGSLSRPADAPLVPFYAVGEQWSCLYFPVTPPDRYEADREKVDRQAAVERAVDARTVDHVVVGDFRSESDHKLQSVDSAAGTTGGPFPFWRDAHGSFASQVSLAATGPTSVRCVYFGSDAGRDFDVSVDGKPIGTEHLTAARPGEFVVATYPVPRELTPTDRRPVTVRFRPPAGSIAGGVLDVRTVRG